MQPAFFAGAAPAPVDNNFFNPEPAQPRHTQFKASKQNFRPAPSFQQFAPSPKPQIDYQDFATPAPRPAPSNYQQQPRNNQAYSMLDELLKEYALPRNGAAPLHDITFGSF